MLHGYCGALVAASWNVKEYPGCPSHLLAGLWYVDGVLGHFCTSFCGPGFGQVLREELESLKAKRQELRKEISAT